jgi:hypothetical protein
MVKAGTASPLRLEINAHRGGAILFVHGEVALMGFAFALWQFSGMPDVIVF